MGAVRVFIMARACVFSSAAINILVLKGTADIACEASCPHVAAPKKLSRFFGSPSNSPCIIPI
eukprot:1161866-Pelagomonas_calceolata.AAC.4